MPAASDSSGPAHWGRSLAARHGRVTLICLAVICAVGLGLRAERVINPNADPGDDALAYTALAKSLYVEGSYGGEEFRDPNDWSPGAPLLYAGAYYVTGGARDGVARLLQALLGVATILTVYLLGRRIACRPAGLIAAAAVAVYPPFIHSTGAVLSEPPAIFTLPAAVLAFLWAWDRRGTWEWALPGALLGATALIRPEYLFVGIALIAVAAVASALRSTTGDDGDAGADEHDRRGLRAGLAAGAVMAIAFALVIAPWTIRNIVTLDRVVPISTGSGKAIYVGTSLPQDGDYQQVKAALVERYTGRDLEPGSDALDDVDPTPLFDRVAERYPELSRDAALGKIGRDQFSDYLGDQPGDYAAMTVRKAWRMWSGGVGEAMKTTPGRVIQVLIVALAIGGLAVLLIRRRLIEFAVFLTPIAAITAIGSLTLASERRNEILMTLVFPLAAAAVTRGYVWVGERRTVADAAHGAAQA